MKETIQVKVSSLAAAIFLAPPVLHLILWLSAWNIADGAYVAAVEIFQSISITALAILAVLSVILSIVSVRKKSGGTFDWKEDIVLLVISVVVAITFLMFFN